MPLGVCSTCSRAFIYESAPEKGQDYCRHCGTHFRPAEVSELTELAVEGVSLPPQLSGPSEIREPGARAS